MRRALAVWPTLSIAMLALPSCTVASASDKVAFSDKIEGMLLSAPCTHWPEDNPEVIELRRREAAIEDRARKLGLHGAFEDGEEKANDLLAIIEIACDDYDEARAHQARILEDIESFLAERER